MVVLSVIVGILLMMCGFYCIFAPLPTFLTFGVVIAILLLVYGIVGIVNVIRKRAEPITLIVDILAIIVGVIAIFSPAEGLLIDVILVYVVSAWFVIQGVISIVVSIKARKIQKGWVLGLILGIIGVIIGILSFFRPMIPAIAIGLMIGIFLIESGLNMIVFATAVDSGLDENQNQNQNQ